VHERIVKNGMVVRTYLATDANAVWDLHMEGLLDSGANDYERDPKWDDDVRQIQDHYLRAGSHFWVVEAAGSDGLIACAAVRQIDETTGEIKRMRVTKSRRRQGIALLLIEIAEAFCARQGYERVVLDTTDRQAAAQQLYLNNGYVETGSKSLTSISTTLRYYGKRIPQGGSEPND
jgi:GNAT superfamily N-acetyltransferase